VMFAATRPHRVSGLVTYGGSSRWLADDGYPGIPPDALDDVVAELVSIWGKPEYATFLAPSMASDAEACEAVGRWLRQALSPGMASRVYALALSPDVRPLLGSVTCPTLVMTPRSAGAAAPLAQAEYLAEIANARLAVFDTADSLPYQRDHREWFHATVQEFLTGHRPQPSVDDRVLATVMFTDLVASTQAAVRLGDSEWLHRLDDIERATQVEVARYKGRLVKTTGDGILATFDGPARAIRCAASIRDDVARRAGLKLRAGVHTGEIELRGEDIGGVAVHIAARVMSIAGPGQVLTSSTVKDLVVGSGLALADAGGHQLKGVPGTWRLYALDQ
jgi:class 3 adenylate cyclase